MNRKGLGPTNLSGLDKKSGLHMSGLSRVASIHLQLFTVLFTVMKITVFLLSFGVAMAAVEVIQSGNREATESLAERDLEMDNRPSEDTCCCC